MDGVRELRATRPEVEPALEPLRLSPPGRAAGDWDWSPDGAVAVASSNDVFLAQPSPDGSGFAEPAACLVGSERVVGLRFSPVGKRLAVVRKRSLLFLAEGPDVREVALPGEAAGQLAWSPDGRLLAVPFCEGDRVDLAVVAAPDGEVIWRTRTDAAEGQPEWVGSRLLFARSDRDALWYEWVVADLARGEEEVWLREEDRRGVWVGVRAAVSPTGSAFALTAPVDGWNHVVVCDLRTGQRRIPLPGEHEDYGHAADRPDFSPDGGRLAFSSSAGNLKERHIWLYDLERGTCEQLTREPGTQVNPVWSPDGRRLAYITCGPYHSAELAVVAVGDGSGEAPAERRLTRSMPAAWTREAVVVPRAVSFPSADGRTVHGDLFVPQGLDRSRRHPAIVYVHGGPIRQMRYGWHPMHAYAVFYAFNQLVLQHGYVVLSVDYRGSTGYGVEYERANYRSMAQGDLEDCVAAARHLASLPFVDARRIAIWGLSYGGYLTLACLCKRPDVFALGINIAGLWRVDQWAEWVAARHPGVGNVLAHRAGLGRFADDEAAFEASPANFVMGLKGPLLNLHGTEDESVDYAQLDRIVEDCVRHGKDFAALHYPGETHMFTKRETWQDAFTRMLRAFERYLRPEPEDRPPAMI